MPCDMLGAGEGRLADGALWRGQRRGQRRGRGRGWRTHLVIAGHGEWTMWWREGNRQTRGDIRWGTISARSHSSCHSLTSLSPRRVTPAVTGCHTHRRRVSDSRRTLYFSLPNLTQHMPAFVFPRALLPPASLRSTFVVGPMTSPSLSGDGGGDQTAAKVRVSQIHRSSPGPVPWRRYGHKHLRVRPVNTPVSVRSPPRPRRARSCTGCPPRPGTRSSHARPYRAVTATSPYHGKAPRT